MHTRPYLNYCLVSSLHMLIVNRGHSAASAPWKSKTRVIICLISAWVYISAREFTSIWRGHNSGTKEPVSYKSSHNENFMSVGWDMTRHLPEHKNPLQTIIPPNTHIFMHTCCNFPSRLKPFRCVRACVKLHKRVFFPGPLWGWYEKNVPHDRGKFLHCQRAAAVGFHNVYLRLKGGVLGSPSGRHRGSVASKLTPQVNYPELISEIQTLQHCTCYIKVVHQFLRSYQRYEETMGENNEENNGGGCVSSCRRN